MKEYLKIPKYMAKEQQTQEVTQKLQESSQGLENYPINQLNLNQLDNDILLKLTEWKSQLAKLDQISQEQESAQQDSQNEQVSANMKQKIQQELDQFQKDEQKISKEQLKQQEFNQHIKQELNDLDKDFDEIDSLYLSNIVYPSFQKIKYLCWFLLMSLNIIFITFYCHKI